MFPYFSIAGIFLLGATSSLILRAAKQMLKKKKAAKNKFVLKLDEQINKRDKLQPKYQVLLVYAYLKMKNVSISFKNLTYKKKVRNTYFAKYF